MKRPRGRPLREDAPVSRKDMLGAAFDLLDHKGVGAFTMRALAERLDINPMTIHHHFGGRDGLIGAMSEYAYERVSVRDDGTAIERIRELLNAYHAQVLRYPGLTMLIFSQPNVFPKQAERITNEISTLLTEAGLPDHRRRLWLEILVDFTHGAALATAMNGRIGTSEPVEDHGFTLALNELLTGLNG
ncbi:putative TetR-family transcriptional regulator [Roseibium aggregatum IAM 12614]|uniref:Putative TetR-family transcriptional regulator n=1 Tax=Roseibium aggregatum (strain ATCC 25650 / DSM 13394 / JCM 20685 / NBRC 16684 / NCIMB 2208 / IAM 12614 / B1) TaxID=384765 RepID=A0NPC8_ROSAI|nr:TetR/AcrR family transcriptional regulator [Roseibium aggregatum]EAV45291.1 putative TetR-family transcriptional regulator [Roseibium aggregatum IAM 12614]